MEEMSISKVIILFFWLKMLCVYREMSARIIAITIILILLALFLCNVVPPHAESFYDGRIAGHGGIQYGPYDEWYLWDPLGWDLSYQRPAPGGPNPYFQ